MNIVKTFVALTLSIASAYALAEDICSAAEQSFREAVSIYSKDGTSAFVERVLRDGPLEGDKRSLSQVQALNQIEQFYGKLISASVLSKKQLGSRTCYLVGIMEYEKGPTFAVATYYLGENGIAGTSMFFKTKPQAIIPRELLLQEVLNE